MNLMVYKAEIDPSPESELEVNYIGLVDRPAIEKNFLAFDEQKKRLEFKIDDEKRIVSGPAMIADLPLYRRDKKLGEYYVVFDKQSIKTIVEKFSAKGYFTNLNLFHDPQQKTDGVVIFNSFISDASIGIAPMKGFEDLADGSWFISAKINDDAVWQKVKMGEIRGFSVEGMFNYSPAMIAQVMSESLKKNTLLYAEQLRAEKRKLSQEETWEIIEPILNETDFSK